MYPTCTRTAWSHSSFRDHNINNILLHGKNSAFCENVMTSLICSDRSSAPWDVMYERVRSAIDDWWRHNNNRLPAYTTDIRCCLHPPVYIIFGIYIIISMTSVVDCWMYAVVRVRYPQYVRSLLMTRHAANVHEFTRAQTHIQGWFRVSVVIVLGAWTVKLITSTKQNLHLLLRKNACRSTCTLHKTETTIMLIF